MSVLDRVRTRTSRSRPAGRPSRSLRGAARSARDGARPAVVRGTAEGMAWTLAGLAGLQAAVVSLVVVALPLMVGWALAARTTAPWGDATRVVAQAWLLAHHVPVQLPGGTVGLTPLGLTLVPALTLWWAGRRVGEQSGRGPRPVVVALLWLTLGYALVVTGVAALATAQAGRPVLWRAAVGGVVLALLVAGASATRTRPDLARALASRVPAELRATARPAVGVAAALVGVGGLVLAASLAVHLGRVTELHRALAPGVVGGLVLALAQVGVVPNLVLWSVSWVSGAGFALGAGTAVTPGASTLGLLPLVPVLGAVPEPGALPVWCVAAPLVPVLVGAVAGWRVGGLPAEGRWTPALRGLLAAALAALALCVAVALSAGAAGPGRMAQMGPTAWLTGLVLLGELALGATGAAWVRGRRTARGA